MKNKEFFRKMIGWGITFITPILILMFSIRILITPVFPKIEYRMPGFPEDPYGFTLKDRLRWSEPSIRYLINKKDVSYLARLAFESGEPIFNTRELDHMEDVKTVITMLRIGLWSFIAILVLLVFIAIKNGWKKEIRRGFFRGGWGVIGLVVAILLFVMISFKQLFTWFHQIFFEGGTWMFSTSDTLIRLFPMRFWRDAFIFVGGLSLVLGIFLIFLHKEKCS